MVDCAPIENCLYIFNCETESDSRCGVCTPGYRLVSGGIGTPDKCEGKKNSKKVSKKNQILN
jgi:hypothetical protein